jgi:hypothetical protein
MLTLMPAGAQPSDIWGNPTFPLHSYPRIGPTSSGRRCGQRAALTGYRTSSSAALSLRARATNPPSSSGVGSAFRPAGLSNALRARPSAPQRQCMGPLTRPKVEGSCFALARKPLQATSAAPLPAPKTRAFTRSGQNGPRGPRHDAIPKDRPPRAVGCARPSLASSLGRGKPPRQLTALGWPPRAPDSPAFHSVKTAETGTKGRWRRHPQPAHHQPLLRKRSQVRWPPLQPGHALAPEVSLASGSTGQLVLPPSLSLTVQKPEQRDPAPRDAGPVPRGVRAASFCSGYGARACAPGPPQNWPHSLPPQR